MTDAEKQILTNQVAIMLTLSGLIANRNGVSLKARDESQDGLRGLAENTLKELGYTPDQINYVLGRTVE